MFLSKLLTGWSVGLSFYISHNYPVPVRKSQKLADRVTAVQKPVAPYGKVSNHSKFRYPASIRH